MRESEDGNPGNWEATSMESMPCSVSDEIWRGCPELGG